MALSNAERQRMWRNKRNKLAKQAESGQRKGPQALRNDKLADELDALLEKLFLEGQKNMATMSPGTVMRLACLLDRALVAGGVIRPNKRTEDVQGYIRSYKAKKAHADRKVVEA
jgi:hypothetical protein